MVDSRNFILNTDYPLDQIIYLKTGQFSGTGTSFAHNLGYKPLIIGTWSTDSSFYVSKESGGPDYEVFDPSSEYIIFGSNATDIIISRVTSQIDTRYFRIYGFMPSDVNVDTPPTATLSNNFIFNTDYNYTKLLKEGIVPSSGGYTNIEYNLGYRPQVTTWTDNSNGYTTVSSPQKAPQVTENLIVIPPSSYNTHYKIYTDAQV